MGDWTWLVVYWLLAVAAIAAALISLWVFVLYPRHKQDSRPQPDRVPESLGLDRFELNEPLPEWKVLKHPDVIRAAKLGGMTVHRVVELHDQYINSKQRVDSDSHFDVCSICKVRDRAGN